MKQHHQQHHPSISAYLAVFAILMALTALTVTVSWLHLPTSAGIPIGIAIALCKAGLVAAFFMHLKGERSLIYGFLGLAFVFLILLFTIPISDSVATAGRRLDSSPVGTDAAESHVP